MTEVKNNNALTLQSYQDKTQEYIDGTPGLAQLAQALKNWLDQSLSYAPSGGKILEVGSGFGRDAQYVKQQGFAIECSDAVPNFVKLLQQKGFSARLINLLTDDLGQNYDLILADAVLLHFTPKEFAKVAKKIHQALKRGGIFSLTLKRGNGATWTKEKLGKPRYFYFWQEDDVKAALKAAGFEWVTSSQSHTSHNNADWIYIIVKAS